MVPDQSESGVPARVSAVRAKRWLLLRADRWQLTGWLSVALFVVFVGLGAFDPVGIREMQADIDPIGTLFQGLLTAIITGVTVVVTINQLVLSQELGSVGDQRDRMRGAMEFRREVEDILERPVSPADPASFLQALADRVVELGDRLMAAADGATDSRRGAQLRSYAAGLSAQAESVSRRLEPAEFGTFDVVEASLEFDYSVKLHEARELRLGVGAAEDDQRDSLKAIVQTLELFSPAREHIKTLYFQWELINLSRAVLTAAVPALVVTTAMILYVTDPAAITGHTVGVDNVIWVVSGSATVALLPFMLLLSYILRITTVAKRTLAIGPFVLDHRDGLEAE